ncbi:MAG: aminotransferase class I/II-fold pyridoxal phosphate-dependent enzyme, partial [Candidatus Aminicenantaceae bacterium]
MSFSDKIREQYLDQLQQIKDAGIFKQERFIHSSQAAEIDVEFPEGSGLQRVINMCSNNYLGLADHPALAEAAARAARDFGVGAGASRLISGSMRVHEELEARLAA